LSFRRHGRAGIKVAESPCVNESRSGILNRDKIGNDMPAIGNDESSAAKDRWWKASFLKGPNGNHSRFNFFDGIWKPRRFATQSRH